MSYGDDKPEVSYNQAFLQQKRIDELTSRINTLSSNPLQDDLIRGQKNYQTIYNDLLSLFYQEISLSLGNKLKDPDKKLVEDQIQRIDYILIKYPIYNYKEKIVYGRPKRLLTLEPNNWNVLRKALFELVSILYKLMNDYGLGNPFKDDDEGL